MRAQLAIHWPTPSELWSLAPREDSGELGKELVAFARWCVQRADLHTPWSVWWGRAKGDPRKLGPRRVSLPLFGADE